MSPDLHDVIVRERDLLVRDLEGLDDAGWRTPSLCTEWTVEDVVAHLTQRNVTTPVGLALGALRHRGLQKLIDHGVAAGLGDTPAETLAKFQESAARPTPGPGASQTYLGELVIHAEDIRRPLGITHLYPHSEVAQLLTTRARMARRLTSGLSLVATDTGQVVGRGASVRGPAMSLLMVVSGRRAHLEDLTGPGRRALAGRLGTTR